MKAIATIALINLIIGSCWTLDSDLGGDEDTIVINACENCREKRQGLVPVAYPSEVLVPLEGTACDSIGRKQRGKCSRLSDCYPLLFSTKRDEWSSQGLIEIFKQGSGICEPDYIVPVVAHNRRRTFNSYYRSPLKQAPENELICCVSGQSKYPLPLPQPTPANNFEKFVVGGQRVSSITKYPWMASLHIRGRHSCGGSLINRYTVLTAAHCVKDLRQTDIANMRIYFGHIDVSDINRAGAFEVRTAAQVKYHRLFSMRTLQDDIALIVLNQPVEKSAKIAPVSLTDVTTSDAQSTVSGWGQTSWTSPTSPVLLEATMRVWSNAECQTKYLGFIAPVQISLKQVCAGSPGIDSCRGDSGGPLHVNRGGVLQQVGVVSFGGKCGDYPGVYTKVASYMDWINKNKKE